VVVLAAVALLIWGACWVVTPGQQVPTDVVITPDAVAVVHLAGDERAQGLVHLLGAAMTAHDRRQRRAAARETPDLMRWLERFGAGQETQPADAIGMWIPKEATMAVLPAAPDEGRVVLAANFRGFVRPIRAMLTAGARGDGGKASVYTHAGREVARWPGGGALALAGGTLVWGEREALVEAVLDRIAARAAATGPAFLPEGAYERLQADHALVGAADNRNGALTAMLRRAAARAGGEAPELPPHPLVDLVERLETATLAVAFPSSDRARVKLTARCRDEEAAEAWQNALFDLLEAVREDAAKHGIEIGPELRADGREVTAVIHLAGLRNLFEAWAEGAAAPTGGDSSEDDASSGRPPPEAPLQ